MANSFGKDILIQAEDPQKAARFYTEALGFTVADTNPRMIGLMVPISIFSSSPARRWDRCWK
jgi:hypothetical protein